ncbi:eukaryotic aspartyl protease family protein [Artemisia annua]|uniref:Eukaryotic aspartyl protease family protein n=1 Tax=Artemisia annua TaxID=35608 RepID=A0A2U1KB73_ARTAN|nr:eukaryotic aspartyl protease family protein [Artemisia annua]
MKSLCLNIRNEIFTDIEIHICNILASPNTSSTSQRVPCDSSSCRLCNRCSARPDICPYQVNYLLSNTSSTGILIEDDLHLKTGESPLKDVNAKIKFGCGMIQTGSFLDGAAPNGLFGLVIYCRCGLTANSFSMCFSPDGAGRIDFGDKGSLDQGETPFNLDTPHRTYNISMTQTIVGDNVTNVDFTAIFDTGTSFTYLNDPAYSIIGESIASQTEESRSQPSSDHPFKYCYDIRSNGGSVFCLGIAKSDNVNIIGQNFMTGYRVVFDREKNIIGWKASNRYNAIDSNTLPINPQASPSGSPRMSLGPEAISKNGSPNSSPGQPGNFASALSYTNFIIVLYSYQLFHGGFVVMCFFPSVDLHSCDAVYSIESCHTIIQIATCRFLFSFDVNIWVCL